MLRRIGILFMFFASLACFTAQARGMANIQRGGLGFLFPDNNSFVNPGQFSTSHATAVEAAYTTQSVAGMNVQSVTPSFVYGNGTFGLGASGTRAGTSLTTSGSYIDIARVGGGFSAMKERLTVGVSYQKILTTAAQNGSDGVLGLSMTLQAARRMGPVVGVGYTKTMGTTLQTAIVGVGYGFQSSNSVEANILFSDLNNTDDYTASGYLNLGHDWFFLGGGYSFANIGSVSSAQARVGAVFGAMDASVYASAPFNSGTSPTYGGMLRGTF